MTPDEFKNEMLKIDEKYGGDLESCHAYMDDLMCSLLTDLGYKDGIEIFNNTDKWYA